VIVVACSILVISQKSPVASALFLIATMVSIAILFLLLNAPLSWSYSSLSSCY
jgi:NADH:ubiquinone oxidoreductase subunit 6 (subunit J)